MNAPARERETGDDFARPFVTCNFALTWDGRVTTQQMTPADFSSPRDKFRMLEIRATADAIIAGAGTIAADNMAMGLASRELQSARLERGWPAYPQRVIVSNSGQLDPSLRVFQKDLSPLHLFSTTRMPDTIRSALAGKARLDLADAPTVDLPHVLRALYHEFQVRRLVCEGGPQLFRSMLAADLVDELHVTFGPRIFGSAAAPTLTGPAGPFLDHSMPLALDTMERIGDEVFLRYRVTR